VRLLAVVSLACCVPLTAVAGQRLIGSAGVAGAAIRSVAEVGTTVEASSGTLIGVEARAGISRFTVDVSYLQGTLNPESGTVGQRDYVEGSLLLSVLTFPGISLRVGPHARAYLSEAGTQRWLFWTGRVRGDYTLIRSPAIAAFAEGWLAWTAEVNVSETFDNARGGVIGMSIGAPGTAFYGRLSYSIEQARMGGGTRRDTVEGITVVVGFGRR
jgi:hypothetical protein